MYIDALKNTLGMLIPKSGDHATSLPGVSFHRRNEATEPLHCIYTLSLCLVVQGEKKIQLGSEFYDCVPGDIVLSTIDLPVISHVSKASVHEPFLAVLCQLDISLLFEVNTELGFPPPRKEWPYKPLSIENASHDILNIFSRFVGLHGEPDLQPHILPLVQKELLIRLLNGPQGAHLRKIVAAGSPSKQIAEAVRWLKQNFKETVCTETLAANANMSPSNFRKHFRAITGISPLQFQKKLRLQEARELMLFENKDASQASSNVGYESASQFSREYSRMFGSPPRKDIENLRKITESAN